MKKEGIILGILILISLSMLNAEMIQDSLHVNINVQDSSNNSLVGTFSFILSISNDSLCSNLIANYTFNNVQTSPIGNVNFYLDNSSMNYNTQYYLKEVRDGSTIGCFKIAYSKNHMINNLSELTNDLNFLNSTTLIESDPSWNGNYSIFTGLINNESYLSTYNDTYNLWTYNQTIPANSYTDSVNTTQTNWINLIFVKIADLVSLVGNWSEDKPNYWNSTQLLNGTLVQNDTLFNLFYTKTQIDNNLSLFYLNSNPLNFLNITSISNSTIVRSGSFNCSGSNVLQNYTINSSGAFGQCVAVSSGNPFDQVLNTTSNVTFDNLNMTGITTTNEVLNYRTFYNNDYSSWDINFSIKDTSYSNIFSAYNTYTEATEDMTKIINVGNDLNVDDIFSLYSPTNTFINLDGSLVMPTGGVIYGKYSSGAYSQLLIPAWTDGITYIGPYSGSDGGNNGEKVVYRSATGNEGTKGTFVANGKDKSLTLDMNYVKITANNTAVVCNSTYGGSLYYNGVTKKHYGCNSTTWNDLY